MDLVFPELEYLLDEELWVETSANQGWNHDVYSTLGCGRKHNIGEETGPSIYNELPMQGDDFDIGLFYNNDLLCQNEVDTVDSLVLGQREQTKMLMMVLKHVKIENSAYLYSSLWQTESRILLYSLSSRSLVTIGPSQGILPSLHHPRRL